jgi:hypothetical protein
LTKAFRANDKRQADSHWNQQAIPPELIAGSDRELLKTLFDLGAKLSTGAKARRNEEAFRRNDPAKASAQPTSHRLA